MLSRALLTVPLSALVLAMTLSACGASDITGVSASPSPSTEAAEKVTVQAAAEQDVSAWQQHLMTVNCYSGPVDGASAPQTQAAIRAFQATQGLPVDGQLGPRTEAALSNAAHRGTRVCRRPAPITPRPPVAVRATGEDLGRARVSSASYEAPVTIQRCSINAARQSVTVGGSGDGGLVLELKASGDAGTFSLARGSEQGTPELKGKVTELTVGPDRSFTATGRYGGGQFAGEPFTVHGRCRT